MVSRAREDGSTTWAVTKTKYYSENFEFTDYEDAQENTKEVVFISAPTGLTAAQVTYKENTVVTEEFYHILTDHLGSITNLLLNNGVAIESEAQFTYDAWGRVRQMIGGSYNYAINTLDFRILERGYTGHEHLLEHDIINMNGRIYDPILGQFMQPDNYIQTPEDFLGYDRYTYCRGNPLKYVDPSGESFVGGMDNEINQVAESFNIQRMGDLLSSMLDGGFSNIMSKAIESINMAGEIAKMFDDVGSSGDGGGRSTEKKDDNDSDKKDANVDAGTTGTVYRVDSDGTITAEGTTDDGTDVYMAYDDGNFLVDIMVTDAGAMKKSMSDSRPETINDKGISKAITLTTDVYETYNDKLGSDFFYFLADNTNVEIGLGQFGFEPNGRNTVSISNSGKKLNLGLTVYAYMDDGVRELIHSHPKFLDRGILSKYGPSGFDGFPSGWTKDAYQMVVMNERYNMTMDGLGRTVPLIQWSVYTPGNNSLVNYTHRGIGVTVEDLRINER